MPKVLRNATASSSGSKSILNFGILWTGLLLRLRKAHGGPDDKVDAKLVKQLLRQNNLEPDFSAGELFKVWRKM